MASSIALFLEGAGADFYGLQKRVYYVPLARMRTRIFIPPVSKPTGGVTVLLQLARVLGQSGRDVALVLREPASWLPQGLEDVAPVQLWEAMDLGPADMWVAPEGWVNALTPGLACGATCVSYCQNWAYLFSSLPEGVSWHQLNVSFLAVSDPVGRFVADTTGRTPLLLRPGIDIDRFTPPDKRFGGVRIAYMPRKNKALARQIRDIFHSRNPETKVRFMPIEGQNADGVANILQQAHIFLATGFPEGCPLPPLEAMACGCLCVGFGGFGGWDYMRQVQPEPRFMPWWPLREVPWAGNGFWSADGDVYDAALHLEEAVRWVEEADPRLDGAVAAARMTAESYSLAEQQQNILAVWKELEGH
jgi:hypothetical protein